MLLHVVFVTEFHHPLAATRNKPECWVAFKYWGMSIKITHSFTQKSSSILTHLTMLCIWHVVVIKCRKPKIAEEGDNFQWHKIHTMVCENKSSWSNLAYISKVLHQVIHLYMYNNSLTTGNILMKSDTGELILTKIQMAWQAIWILVKIKHNRHFTRRHICTSACITTKHWPIHHPTQETKESYQTYISITWKTRESLDSTATVLKRC